MKTFSQSHSCINDFNEMMLDVENQIFVKGEIFKVNDKQYQILDFLSPVIKMKVKEIKPND